MRLRFSALSLALTLWITTAFVLGRVAQAQSYNEESRSLTSVQGTFPYPAVLDTGGNLYTATQYGGKYGYGTVLKVNSKTSTVLYSFTGGADGANPHAGLTVDSSGNLYGTTFYGGAYGYGVVYELSRNGTETVLHSFSSGADGANPSAVLKRTSAGMIYGTTPYGGASSLGTIFQIDTTGVETVLYSFSGGDGSVPVSTLLLIESDVYGVTSSGGAFGAGTVFRYGVLSKKLKTLYSFTGGADGSTPLGGLVANPAGTLYGTARYGGAYGQGVVFWIYKTGNYSGVFYNFSGGADGGQPLSGVISDSQGNLYGTAWQGGAGYGVVFEVSSSGTETVLHTFSGGADGSLPEGGVVMDSKGNLYGNTYAGGTNGFGVVYALIP
jgi:uncharacterized repeat protein (TIGR03803 family)